MQIYIYYLSPVIVGIHVTYYDGNKFGQKIHQ